MRDRILFEEATPIGIRVRTTSVYWNKIVTFKHPSLAGKEIEVRKVLQDPDEIRESRKDPSVLLFYRKSGDYHLCVVVKILNEEGFIVTTYFTEKIKEGNQRWKR